MLTVNVQNSAHGILSEHIFTAQRVNYYRDEEIVPHNVEVFFGVEIVMADGSRELYPVHNETHPEKNRIYVMNEMGKTIATYML